MSKIGTITFHWSENYGAVLQAYALQKYLQGLNVQTEIIDYVPRRIQRIQSVVALRRRNLNYFRKRRLLRAFRKQELCLSKRTYHNNRQLHRHCRGYEKIICGSDQIWNESFSSGAEGRPTLSYFLDFAEDEAKKIAYAASFGTERLSQQTKERIQPLLQRFSNISVRENSGQTILSEMGIPSQTVLDPTLLLPREAYDRLLEGKSFPEAPSVFSYVLHQKQERAQEIVRYVQGHFGQEEKKADELCVSLYEWLFRLREADFVVTNSFHGVAMSLIFHRPFFAVPVALSGMNDRIQTLLEGLGLEERIVCSTEGAAPQLVREIDWDAVDMRLRKLRLSSEKFLADVVKA